MFQTVTHGQGIINPPGINGQKEGYALPQADLLKLPGYNPATKPQDIAEAKRLLAEAGHAGGFSDKLPFSRSSSTTAPIAEMAATQLKAALGIDLSLEPLDAAVYQQRDARGEFNIEMNLVINMDTNLRDRFHSKSPTNTGKINDPELDRLIEAYEATGDPEKRRAAVRSVQQLLLDKLYAIPTVETAFFPLSQPWVKRFNFGYGNPHAAPYWSASDTWIDVKRLPAARASETPKLAGR
jgi:peptide/nickel transport system substrate-binding protein